MKAKVLILFRHISEVNLVIFFECVYLLITEEGEVKVEVSRANNAAWIMRNTRPMARGVVLDSVSAIVSYCNHMYIYVINIIVDALVITMYLAYIIYLRVVVHVFLRDL